MKGFIDKLITRLEEYKYSHLTEHDSEECLHCKENDDDWCDYRNCLICAFEKSEKIVKELAEEYINTSTNTSTDSAEWKQHILNRFEGDIR